MTSTPNDHRRAPLWRWLDAAAIGASAACLVHCLMLPLLFAALPAASRLLSLPESFHLAAFAFAVPASAIAMGTGYRHHGALLPAGFGAIGLLLIGIGALGGLELLLETGVTVAGSLLLATGHLGNWRLRARAIRASGHVCNDVSSPDSAGDCRCA
jgi:hypothetical protein